jgi:6-phosphogluconolactonase
VSSAPQTIVHGSPALLAAATAARLVTRLVDTQAARGSASVVLTGGRTGTAVLEQLRATPARDAVDWSRVDFYWGDERFLPAGDPERNETQARVALLDHVPVDPARVHPMAPSDGEFGDDPEAAAEAYAELLAAAARAEDHYPAPTFDVCLLGVGEEGHTASIFPDSPAVYETERSVVAVHGCPKPPPVRLSLTLPALWWRWRWAGRARSPCRPPARGGSPARSGCSTRPPPRRLPESPLFTWRNNRRLSGNW